MITTPINLWRNSDFRKLWAGQTISIIGSQIKFLALPLTAVLFLEATPAQMGYLEVAGALPGLLIGLLAGVWVDRLRHRPILIATDLGRALLLLSIPALALASRLRMEHLYLITCLTGILGVFFGVAYHSYLPTIASREQLIEGNSKLELSRSAAEIISPGLGGLLVQWLTAPVAILFDALSFLASAFFLMLIRTPEPAAQARTGHDSVWREIGSGLRFVTRHPLLRPLAGSSAVITLFNTMLETVWILYLSHELGLMAGLLGVIRSTGGVGFVIGALLPEQATRRFGLGRTMVGGVVIAALGDLLTPLAGGSLLQIAVTLIAGEILFGIGATVYGVGQTSLRQAVTPHELQGRMNATVGFLESAAIPVGALLGGALGTAIGLRATLFLAACGFFLAALWLRLSPVWGVLSHDETGKIQED